MIRALLMAALLAAAGTVFADDFIFTHGEDSVILTMKPCELPIPQKDQMLAAKAKVGGQDFLACWAPLNREVLYLVYDDQSEGLIPFRALRPLPEL